MPVALKVCFPVYPTYQSNQYNHKSKLNRPYSEEWHVSKGIKWTVMVKSIIKRIIEKNQGELNIQTGKKKNKVSKAGGKGQS